MAYDIDMAIGDTELLKRIIKKIQKYERDCMKKNESSSPTQIKKMIEEACHED